jgi:hypothetical protein
MLHMKVLLIHVDDCITVFVALNPLDLLKSDQDKDAFRVDTMVRVHELVDKRMDMLNVC